MSVLGGVQKVVGLVGTVGHATFGHTAIARPLRPRAAPAGGACSPTTSSTTLARSTWSHVPLIYTFNLAGYRPSALPAGGHGRYTLGGFTDATFTAMSVLEAGGDAQWPF